QRAADPLVKPLLVLGRAESDEEQPPHLVAVLDEGLGHPAKLAFEPLALRGAGCDGPGGLTQARQPVGKHVLAPDGKSEGVGAGGALRSEADVHVWEGLLIGSPLGSKPNSRNERDRPERWAGQERGTGRSG